ncbi:trypsin-like serine protease, partial [Streptomyces sp. SP17BM10]|uniref:trypsin-like serine protease n=1 Tax=Streptomyces sp. SP17BM10 TaxID=3002530 RepID=UPI002E78A578
MALHIRRWLTAAVATAAVLGAAEPAAIADTPTTTPAANTAAAFAAEDGAYPDAQQLQQATGMTVTRGDGGIVYTPCDTPHQITIWGRSVTLPMYRACFTAPGASGYLALNVPDAFRIETTGRTLHANLTTDGSAQSVDVAADSAVGVGEGAATGSHSVLLELNVTGSTAQPPAAPKPDPGTAATARIAVGSLGRGGRACTGTLVAPQWVLSAADCFATDPADFTTAHAGLLPTRTTATIGTHTVEVVEIAPRTDRDLVLARLAVPVYDVTPIAVSTTAPATGEALTVAGWGRTATTWVPDAPHAATLTAAAVTAGGVDLTAKTAADTVCKGDAGAPALRTENGKPAIAAVTSRAWQGGCLGTDPAETRTGASEARVDDLASWVGGLVNRSYQLVNPASGRCVNVSGQGPTWDNLNPIILFDCVPGAGNEAFQLTASGQLYNPASKRC